VANKTPFSRCKRENENKMTTTTKKDGGVSAPLFSLQK
jgi:hypothetical protein